MEVAFQNDQPRSTATIEDDIIANLQDSSEDSQEILLNTIDEEVEADDDDTETAEDDYEEVEDDEDDADTGEDDEC